MFKLLSNSGLKALEEKKKIIISINLRLFSISGFDSPHLKNTYYIILYYTYTHILYTSFPIFIMPCNIPWWQSYFSWSEIWEIWLLPYFLAGPLSFDFTNSSKNSPTLKLNPYSWTKVWDFSFLYIFIQG